MKPDASPERLRRRYDRLRQRLARFDLLLVGTITERYDDRVPPGSPPRGPYHQWTYKQRGKTVTVNLSPTQAKAFQKAIDNQRKLEAILREMRALSRAYLEATTPGVKRRKPRHDALS